MRQKLSKDKAEKTHTPTPNASEKRLGTQAVPGEGKRGRRAQAVPGEGEGSERSVVRLANTPAELAWCL
jgi:hypothetical protein